MQRVKAERKGKPPPAFNRHSPLHPPPPALPASARLRPPPPTSACLTSLRPPPPASACLTSLRPPPPASAHLRLPYQPPPTSARLRLPYQPPPTSAHLRLPYQPPPTSARLRPPPPAVRYHSEALVASERDRIIVMNLVITCIFTCKVRTRRLMRGSSAKRVCKAPCCATLQALLLPLWVAI
ncbi:protein diaphanous homolog 1-like [Penaeus chinensis]|uniref:protein diaphanous homolog 1-like n=1 Tax=Penaeus chinensis TaxID=139456 RepID=UPI001FB5FDDF|nr:protein diaphanous homolog 1-like [Penaeus chinensis]